MKAPALCAFTHEEPSAPLSNEEVGASVITVPCPQPARVRAGAQGRGVRRTTVVTFGPSRLRSPRALETRGPFSIAQLLRGSFFQWFQN